MQFVMRPACWDRAAFLMDLFEQCCVVAAVSGFVVLVAVVVVLI